MDQLRDYADERLKVGCVYCHGGDETKDHVPSRIFLDRPFPDNLPVVGACWRCNNGFSADEEYVACLIEAAVVESTDPGAMRRERVAKILGRSPALRRLIDAHRAEADGKARLAGDPERVRNVILKLARGHAAFELGRPLRSVPDDISWWPLPFMSTEERDEFDAPHIPGIYGEVGSRSLQRMQVVELTLQSESGELKTVSFLINDWLEVQEGRYRYIAIDDPEEVTIRIVIGEYLGAEVSWRNCEQETFRS